MGEREDKRESAPGGLVRVNTPDLPRAAKLLARAFQVDPLMTYAFPDVVRRERLLPLLIGWSVRYGNLYGEGYATSGWEGVAIWLPPGKSDTTPWRMLRAGMFSAPLRLDWETLRRLAQIQEHMTRLHRLHAPAGHWYLSQIGVEPIEQAKGWGSALLRPLLERFDAARCWLYLDTTHEAALHFYQRHDFFVAAESDTARGGPHLWALLRPPAEGASFSSKRGLTTG